jgi:hypothetical protein
LAGGVSAACRAGRRTVGGSHGPPRQRALARGEGATRHRGSAACRAGCYGRRRLTREPCASYRPGRRGLLPWLGALPAEPGAPCGRLADQPHAKRTGPHAPVRRRPRPAGRAGAGSGGEAMIRAIPCASYRPDRRELLPWPGAPPTEPGASVRTAGGSNPMQSGQDPMHQCAGGPGLHARSIERPGRAALILAYSTHPTCPVEGRSSPGPGLPGRTRRIVMTGGGQNPMHQCHPRARSL